MKQILFLLCLSYLSIHLSAQSANWTAVNPNFFPTNVSGQIHGLTRVSQLKFHPTNSQKMYAISARGGLFISTNGGNNWTVAPGTDNMPYNRLASVCIDHNNDQILYLGTGDHNYYYTGSGVWKSTDGGTTFNQIGLSGKLVIDMIMDPLDSHVIVAITNSGIYKTTTTGASWNLMTASRPFDEIKQRTPTSRVLYACTADSAFFRSTDFGDTWNQITAGIVLPAGITNGNGCRIAVTLADTNVVYLGMVANGGTIYKSTNGGTSFTPVKTAASPYLTYYTNSSSSSSQGDYNFGIGVDRSNANILYLVAHCVWKSTDGGANWSQLTNWWANCHTDMHQIVTNPYDNTKLYNMNDGGVWLSTDAGANWTPKSDGMNGYEIYHGNCSPTRKDMMSIGTQDNGELYANSSGWFTNRGGDWGSQCAFDYRSNSDMVYYYGSNMRRSVSGSESSYGLPSRVVDLDYIAFYRGNTGLAYVADSFIYRTNNLTASTPTWTQIAALGTVIKAVQVSYSDPNVLYVVTNDSKFYISTNANTASPTFTQYNLPGNTNIRASITSIKNSPGTIYITANAKVFKSVNYGVNWADITSNLPAVNHIRVLADEYFPASELVFVASNNAVYYKTVNASNWTLYSTNLPSRTDAIDLSIFNDSTSNTSLRYACYGRSVWETPISNLRVVSANFSADNPNPCLGNNVQFSDLSTGNITSRTWTFQGGTPSTSTASNPTVVYNAAGIYSVTLTVSDGVTSSTYSQPNYVNTNGSVIPMSESFETSNDPPQGWKNLDLGTSGIAWAKTSSAGGYAASASSMMFDNYSWNFVGETDQLQTKRLDLSSAFAAKLYFDVAYQVFSGYSDTLSVLISTDCGNTFSTIYKKGGSVLSTAGSGGNNFVPTSSQWRTDTVSLNAYAGNPSVILSFQNWNGYGNKLYIDHVNVEPVLTCPTPLVGGTISGPISMTAGVNSNFSITGNTGNTMQWQYSSNSGSNWNNISGANTNNASFSLSGGIQWVRAAISQTGTNCPTVYSNIFIINVDYQLGDIFSNPIIVTLPFSTTTSNTIGSGFNSYYNGANQQSSPDIFYRFTTGSCTDSISISTCGSSFDTHIHLLDASGNNIVSNNDNGPYCNGTQASLRKELLPNTIYYVVVEGNGSSTGNISLNIQEIDNPILSHSISAGGSTSICVGQTVVLTSTQATGNLWSNNATTPSITVSTTGNYSCIYTSPSGCTSTSNNISVNVISCQVNLSVKLFIEGYYLGASAMQPVLFNQGIGSSMVNCDNMTIELHQSTSPYATVYSQSAMLQTNGIATSTFPPSAYGQSYYIVIKHRNALETWSSSPVLMQSNTSFDFSNAASKAYGNNEKVLGSGVFGLISGDVLQDQSIDAFDSLLLLPDISNGVSGYVNTDLNGDGSVDSFDFLIMYPHIYNGITVLSP